MRAYAERRGCDVSAVSRQVSKGRISLIDGKIDPEVADVQWARTTRPRADNAKQKAAVEPVAPGEDDAGTTPEGYWESRSRREKTEADKADIELAKLVGTLIERTGVEMAIDTAFRQTRDAIMAVPDKLPIATDVRLMFRSALHDAFADSQKMLPATLVEGPAQ